MPGTEPTVAMRRHISRELNELALRLSQEQGLPDRLIKEYTGTSTRSLERIHKTYRDTGEVVRIPVCAGRPRSLDSLDATVSGFADRVSHNI